VSTSAILLTIDGHARRIDGFPIRRVLPSVARRLVGPFLFFDHMGPHDLAPGEGINVRPHPHIGLATVTYLFDGEIHHQDSLDNHQMIRPGDINWMTAGGGIVHSERTPAPRASGKLHGLQLWVALPKEHEERAPDFRHHPGASLPSIRVGAAQIRVLAGSCFGRTSPVETLSPLFYADVVLPAGASLEVPDEYEERAIYVVEGELELEGARAEPGRMWILAPGVHAEIHATRNARLMALGGARLDGERHIYWNFVSSSLERIERAKRDWREGRFPKVPGDDVEFIPLPE